MVTKKQSIDSSKRYQDNLKNKQKAGSDDFHAKIQNSKIKAEYDTWSWYYTELSNLRTECSRLGLLVRVNNINSSSYLLTYHSHIYSYLQLVITVLPTPLCDKIKDKWKESYNNIQTYMKKRTNLGQNLPIPFELILSLDNLYDIALKTAQEIGLGFKISINQSTVNALEKRLIGE